MRRKGCQFHWHNDGYTTFDDFLSRFSSAKRKKARRERRRIEEAGISFQVPSFDLFTRMMEMAQYRGRLFGDISAVTQRNRATEVLVRLIGRQDWHPRLLNGSDYPLPGVMPIFSVDALVESGLLDASSAPPLKTIRSHNPLLFDFVLKRALRADGKSFAPS